MNDKEVFWPCETEWKTGDSQADTFAQLDRIEEKLNWLVDNMQAKKKPKPRAAKNEAYTEQFEALWKEYPKCAGNKRKTYSAYCKRIEEGSAWIELKVGLEKYSAFVQATGRYVMLPATFFGPDKHYENDWTIPDSARKSAIPRDDNEMVAWAKQQGLREPRPGESYNAYRAYVESEA